MRRWGQATAPYALVVAMALLGAGTISNQLKINAANDTLRTQAENGQRSLNRQCTLVPMGVKGQRDLLRRHVITRRDFGMYVQTAAAICPRRR